MHLTANNKVYMLLAKIKICFSQINKYVNKNLEMSGTVIMQLVKNHPDLDSFYFSALSPFQAWLILRV